MRLGRRVSGPQLYPFKSLRDFKLGHTLILNRPLDNLGDLIAGLLYKTNLITHDEILELWEKARASTGTLLQIWYKDRSTVNTNPSQRLNLSPFIANMTFFFFFANSD